VAIRQGLVQGLVQGSKCGINYWEVITPTETIYDQDTAADVNTFIQELLNSSNDFTPMDVYTMDDLVGGFVGNNQQNQLQAVGGISDEASPHGRAISTNPANSGKYWISTSADDEFVFGTSPFAFAIRVKVNATTLVDRFFVSKGIIATAFNGFGIAGTTGNVFSECRLFGGVIAVADSGVPIADGEYRWILGGRSVADAKVWIYLAGQTDAGTATFAADKNINSTGREFGVWDSAFTDATVDCSVDHMIVWSGTAAENVYTNRTSLLFEDA
jgi:hypothetical protein